MILVLSILLLYGIVAHVWTENHDTQATSDWGWIREIINTTES